MVATRWMWLLNIWYVGSAPVWITINCGKFWKRWDYQITLPVFWETCMWSNSWNRTWNNRLVHNWKGVRQGCILWPCLFNLYAEYIMRDARMGEAQDGVKIAGRNINSLRYADNTTLMAESEEQLKSLLMSVKEESEKASLKRWKIRPWHLVPSLHGK